MTKPIREWEIVNHGSDHAQYFQGAGLAFTSWTDREHNEILEYDKVCEDCIYYAEYGRLDDKTMSEIEKS